MTIILHTFVFNVQNLIFCFILNYQYVISYNCYFTGQILEAVFSVKFQLDCATHVGLNIFYFTIFYITKVHTCKHYQNKRIGTKAKMLI